MSVRAIGVDIVKVLRIARILAGPRRDRFLGRVLHHSEFIAYLKLVPDSRGVQYVAGSWAAKEAVFKTLDVEQQQQFAFKEWYRCKTDGKPGIGSEVPLAGNRFLLSISHDGDHLVATALRLVEDS